MNERRVFPVEGLEFREAEDGKLHFRGYAAVFNSPSEPIGGAFIEKISPGAFAKTIKDGDIRMLINHDPNKVLARSKAGVGTLSLSEDSHGLNVEADMAPTSYARDLSISMQRGDISQMSFGFQKVKDSWDRSDKTMPTRTLTEVRAFDVSPVTFPAYPSTTASVRNEARGIMMAAGLDAPELDLSDIDIDLALAFLTSGEERVGKAISAANADKIRAAIEALEAMLGMDDEPGKTPSPMNQMNSVAWPKLAPGELCPFCATPLLANKKGEAFCEVHGVNPNINNPNAAITAAEMKYALTQELEARKRRLRLLEVLTAA